MKQDLISRQAAIDALRKMQTYKMFSGDDMLLIDQAGAMAELMLLPPAEPKRGKWIDNGEAFICSECRSGYKEQPTLMGKPMFEFCPNCGAKMEVNNEID